MNQTSTLENAPLNVLLVEDEESDRLAVRSQLEVMGLKVTDTASPIEAKEFFYNRDISLIIIHLKAIPQRALKLCRPLRAESTVPILMLTNRSEVIDDVMVMSAGADDYVSKPINNKILVARVNQQIARGQRQRAPRANVLSWGPLRMDLSAHQFSINHVELHLTNTEYHFLRLLMENPQHIFSRNQILEAIVVTKGVGSNQLVDTHASRLRKKIREGGGPEVISVIRSVGFRLSDAAQPLIEV